MKSFVIVLKVCVRGLFLSGRIIFVKLLFKNLKLMIRFGLEIDASDGLDQKHLKRN